jgi:hypothetical protein
MLKDALATRLRALLSPMSVEIAALRVEFQAEREAFSAARQRFEIEMDALQAERGAFLAALDQIRQQPSHVQDLNKLINTVDAALMTLALNGATPGE